MKNKVFIKCQNCGGIKFVPTTIGTILATGGQFNVNAYACQNCGHIQLFDPKLDLYAKQLREEKEFLSKKEEAERHKAEEERQQRIKELTAIINNEDSTVRQVKKAKCELDELSPRCNNIIR